MRKLDVLAKNAGIAIFGPFAQTTTQDWRKVMATDLDSVYFACREALPHLLKTKGSIVNLSSASGLGADWGLSAYTAAKGAVTNFTRSLALEYGSRGVRINAVAPSLTSTDATADLVKSEAVLAAFLDRLPIGRAATPDEVAGVIAFLASEDAIFINAVILPIDGAFMRPTANRISSRSSVKGDPDREPDRHPCVPGRHRRRSPADTRSKRMYLPPRSRDQRSARPRTAAAAQGRRWCISGPQGLHLQPRLVFARFLPPNIARAPDSCNRPT